MKNAMNERITRMITTKKLLLFAGASLVGFTPHVLAEYPGNAFSVTPDQVELEEGKSLLLTAQAGGARKLYWTIKRDAEDKVVAVDMLTYTFNAGRVVADTDYVLQFKAIYWIRNATDRYMSSGNAIRMLIDTVSKGGNLLLNVPLTPEGELEPTTLTFLTEMGKCLDRIGESIFATRCWMTATDGDSIRFTRSKDNTVLYVINPGWSNDQLVARTLGSSRIDLTTLTGVSLLGSSDKLTYTQDAGGLAIKVGKVPFESPAYAFKLTFSGQIPKLK